MSAIVTIQRDSRPATIPPAACRFAWDNAVQFAATDKSGNGFEIVAYDGQIIPKHWYWGNLAFDLDGLSFEQDRTPVFDSHNYDRRVGFTTAQEIRPKVRFTGQFLENDGARQFRGDMKSGFPMQASLGLVPIDVDQVKEGVSVMVNGHRLEGPGAVFRQAKIREVSMAAFGAAPGTSATAFAAGGPAIIATAFDEATANDEQLRAHFAVAQELKDQFSCAETYTVAVKYEREHPRGPEDLAAENDRLARQKQDLEDKVLAVRLSDEQLRQRFADDKALQDEISSVDAYLAYMKHQREVAQSRRFQESLSR